MITRHLFSKSRGKPNRNNGLAIRNGVKCTPCFTVYRHFLCMLVLLSGGRFSNFAQSGIKNPGCVAEFWAMCSKGSWGIHNLILLKDKKSLQVMKKDRIKRTKEKKSGKEIKRLIFLCSFTSFQR